MVRPVPLRVLLPVAALLFLPSLVMLGIVAYVLCVPGPGPDYSVVFGDGQVVTGTTDPGADQ